MRRVPTLIAGVIVGVGIGLLAIGLLRGDDSVSVSESLKESAASKTLALDSPAPGFELVSLSGEQVALKDFGGKVVLLNFWATWWRCPLSKTDSRSMVAISK